MQTQVPDFIGKPILKRIYLKMMAKQFYWRSAISRAVRTLNDVHCHIAIPMKLNLPDDFGFQESRALPRGLVKKGNHYSLAYSPDFSEMPHVIIDAIKLSVPVAELYFQDCAVIQRPQIYRNYHIPPSDQFKDVYSDNFHQDLVVDQFNLQLFILLQDVTLEHGPFIYLNPIDQKEYLRQSKSRLDNLDYPGIPFIGKRGDAMLFSTGYTLHRASSPSEFSHRDLMSIAFFPAYAGMNGLKIDELVGLN